VSRLGLDRPLVLVYILRLNVEGDRWVIDRRYDWEEAQRKEIDGGQSGRKGMKGGEPLEPVTHTFG